MLINSTRGTPHDEVFETLGDDERLDSQELLKQKSTINYVIAITGRSGSTMLSTILESTGALGYPAEYTNPRGPLKMYLSRHPASNMRSYINIIRRVYCTPNGVFGLKSNFDDFIPLTNRKMLKNLRPVKFIYLTRKNLLQQAISFVKAVQTKVWHQKKGADDYDLQIEDRLVYDENAILKQINRLLYDQGEWEDFYNRQKINPFRITYEELLDDIVGIVNKISDYLGVELQKEVTHTDIGTKKMADDINYIWAERFKQKYPTY